MMFNSFSFIISFTILLFVLYVLEKININRNPVLLIFSLLFYAFFDYRCLLILLVMIIVVYLLSFKVRENKNYLVIGIVIVVLTLMLFKYFNFFVNSFSNIFNIKNLCALEIILPVGISFYTFKSISYLVDIKRGKCEAEKNIVDLALYISYFPEIVAGPISRSKDLLSQLKENKKLSINNLTDGVQIFMIGLFKKIVIADNISVFVKEVYRAPKIYSSLTVWLCVIAYSIEIYMDFSGYSDMSIGVSKMLGYDIKQNFNLPYMSKNVTEFWKRWHISLSNWLMDYIYIPLGGSRKGELRRYLNLFITMLIGGLWHGSSWTFVLWGAINGIALIIHKLYSKNRILKITEFLSIVLTFVFITLTWIPFNAENFVNAKDVFIQLFSFKSGITYISTWAIFGLIVFVISHICIYVSNDNNYQYPLQNLKTIKGLFIFFMLIGLTIGLAYTGSNPFIYAAF